MQKSSHASPRTSGSAVLVLIIWRGWLLVTFEGHCLVPCSVRKDVPGQGMISFQMLIGKKLKLGVMAPTYNSNIWGAETGGLYHPHWDCKFKANLDTYTLSQPSKSYMNKQL